MAGIVGELQRVFAQEADEAGVAAAVGGIDPALGVGAGYEKGVGLRDEAALLLREPAGA
jgi:hypothetical protein